jgi:hypothetical protein
VLCFPIHPFAQALPRWFDLLMLKSALPFFAPCAARLSMRFVLNDSEVRLRADNCYKGDKRLAIERGASIRITLPGPVIPSRFFGIALKCP